MEAISAEWLTQVFTILFSFAITFGIASLIVNIIKFAFEFFSKLSDENDS